MATSVVNKQSHPAVSKGKSLSLIKDQLKHKVQRLCLESLGFAVAKSPVIYLHGRLAKL